MERQEQTPTRLMRYDAGEISEADDRLATEEPLEIRLKVGEATRSVAVTLRTPGADLELAAGFLFAEGIVERREEIRSLEHCRDGSEGAANIVEVELAEGLVPDLAPLERHFFATSACGVCGKAGLENLRLRTPGSLPVGPVLSPEVIAALPDRLRRSQSVFTATGGLHAAALFSAEGEMLAVREDVGRHNALDKLLGYAFLEGWVPLGACAVLVSGRSSYEILQKCRASGVPIVCSVSAPSSLAVDLARQFGVTLVGFLRGERFNVYSHPERIAGLPTPVAGRSHPRLTVVAG